MKDTTAKAKAPTVAPEGALRNEHQQRQFSPKSTHSEAQRQRILEALRRGPKTTTDLRKIGIFQAPARVKELRDKFGFVIDTQRITLIDEHGYLHPGAARYSLIAEPEAQS